MASFQGLWLYQAICVIVSLTVRSVAGNDDDKQPLLQLVAKMTHSHPLLSADSVLPGDEYNCRRIIVVLIIQMCILVRFTGLTYALHIHVLVLVLCSAYILGVAIKRYINHNTYVAIL